MGEASRRRYATGADSLPSGPTFVPPPGLVSERAEEIDGGQVTLRLTDQSLESARVRESERFAVEFHLVDARGAAGAVALGESPGRIRVSPLDLVAIGSYDGPMLLGRQAECERIDRLLEHARAGQSGVLLTRGEAGIGKSALCAYAAERADGMTVLSAQSVETESELPFSGLAELLTPVLDGLEEIPWDDEVPVPGAA